MFDKRQNTSNHTKINTLPKSTQYIYTGHQRHISLKQYLLISPRQHEIKSSYILDPELSVILKASKSQLSLSQKIIRKDKKDRTIYMLQNQKECEQYKKTYNKYVQINDFLLGRQCQNRNLNCLMIKCDLISRIHTRIKVNAIDSQIKLNQLKLKLKDIVKQSHYSSNLNKLPYSLWQNIIQYLKQQSQYTIQDPGSRNGTFLINQSHRFIPIKPEQAYQLQQQQYLIKINSIITQKGTILFHTIQQMQQDFRLKSQYRHQYSKKVIFCHDLDKQKLKECEEDIHCLYMKIEYNQNLKYYFIVVVRGGQEVNLNVGSGQIIGVNEKIQRLHYELNLHGQICFKQNQWFIYPSDENGYVWIKIPKNVEYPLLTSHNYRFRLGHRNIFSLKFHHFHNK